jgi:Zn-dependent peptidase ImmA (M78 family)
MTGTELAQQVIKRYGTADVAELARLAGVTVRYERWHPVTVGEYHKTTRTICINLNASVKQSRILAHELGHFFIHETGMIVSRAEEEVMAEEFAGALQPYSNTFSITSA